MDEASPRPWWRRVVGSPWFHLAAAFLVTGLILSFVAKPYWVPSGSMETTLQPGDRVLVNRLAYVGASPGTGDIVVFDAGPTWDIEAASPSDPIRGRAALDRRGHRVRPVERTHAHQAGDRHPRTDRGVLHRRRQLIVDGEPLDEPYMTNDLSFEAGELDCTTTPRSARCFDEVEVPADSFLMLGDNRANSSDSALTVASEDAAADCWRWATRADVVGKAVVLLLAGNSMERTVGCASAPR